MRLLLYLAELVAAVAILFVAVKAVRTALERRRERAALTAAEWEPRLVPTTDGHVRVEVAKAGVENPIPVETLDPSEADFLVARAEAQAKAEDLASDLNASED